MDLTQVADDTESDTENLKLAADMILKYYDKQPKKVAINKNNIEEFKERTGMVASRKPEKQTTPRKIRGTVADAVCIKGHAAQAKADLPPGALSGAMERDNADQSRGEQRGGTGRGRAGRTGIRGGTGIRGTTGWPPWRKKDWSSSSSDESFNPKATLACMQCVVSNPISMRWIGHLVFGMQSVPATHKLIIYTYIYIYIYIKNCVEGHECWWSCQEQHIQKQICLAPQLSLNACMHVQAQVSVTITIVPPFYYTKLMLTFKDKLARPVQ